jgi:anhydro-N-acetylmuramic acid kinase
MVYRALGLMSGSSLDGLDLCYVHLQETSGKWRYEIVRADCYAYPKHWMDKLKNAIDLSAKDYALLDVEYGHYLGSLVNRFLNEHGFLFQVQLIGSHGHTTFHIPEYNIN